MQTHGTHSRVMDWGELFPPGVSVAWSDDEDADDALLPDERRCTQGMAPQRLQTFARGRGCAHAALAELGYRSHPVLVGEQRAPLWPPGIAGSISHRANHSVAAACRVQVARSLGVDVEETGDLDEDVLAMICTPEEREWVRSQSWTGAGRVIFSIKESVYKCLWPLARRFIDFQEVQVHVDANTASYSVQALDRRLYAPAVAAIRGGWRNTGDLLLTSAYLPPVP